MSDERLTTNVWVPAGPVAKGDILAQALLDLRDKIPAATLPSADIVDSKESTKDKIKGRSYTVAVTYRPLTKDEGTVSVEDIVADLQPEPFDPAEHDDEK